MTLIDIHFCTLSQAQYNRGEALQLSMSAERLLVSWNPPAGFINNQSKYVVQYKQAGLLKTPAQGFDWIRLDRTQINATLTGLHNLLFFYFRFLF